SVHEFHRIDTRLDNQLRSTVCACGPRSVRPRSDGTKLTGRARISTLIAGSRSPVRLPAASRTGGLWHEGWTSNFDRTAWLMRPLTAIMRGAPAAGASARTADAMRWGRHRQSASDWPLRFNVQVQLPKS